MMEAIQSVTKADEEEEEEIDLSLYSTDHILQLNYKGLKKLPSQLTNFTHITNLFLKTNLLTTLPEDLSSLKNLIVLYLHSNYLTALPESIGELSRLESLDVGANLLTSLPETIGKLGRLKILKFAYNKVTHLPKNIGKLQQLVTLEAMNNQLKSLPLELFECSNLESLYLDSNQLMVIPRQIRQLSQLKELSITGNKLILLPQGLAKSESLKSVYVDCNCHLSVLPVDLLKVQVGSYRCASLPITKVSDRILSNISYVIVRHRDSNEKKLPLPLEIRHQGSLRGVHVLPLLELALRSMYDALHPCVYDFYLKEDIPQMFFPLLTTPTAECFRCSTPVFTSAFPVVFQSQMEAGNMYLLGLCCSVKCVGWCSNLVPVPLVYPTVEDLLHARAAIGPEFQNCRGIH